jgi:hypothetical protein
MFCFEGVWVNFSHQPVGVGFVEKKSLRILVRTVKNLFFHSKFREIDQHAMRLTKSECNWHNLNVIL